MPADLAIVIRGRGSQKSTQTEKDRRQSSPMIRSLCFAAALLFPWTALANPCVLEYVAGRNPLAPAPQKGISIAQETIRFNLHGMRKGDEEHLRGSVRISYEFENHGPAAQVLIGFPIGRYTDRFYPSPNIVGGFRVEGAGADPLLPMGASQQIAIERAGIQRCEATNAGVTMVGEAAGYAWYLWHQTFQPGRNRLEIRYDLHLLSDWHSDSSVVIDYVLSTTAGWGDGHIGRLDVDFRVRGIPGSWKVMKGAPEETKPRPGRRLRWGASNFAPMEDLRFEHFYRSEGATGANPGNMGPKAMPGPLKAGPRRRIPEP